MKQDMIKNVFAGYSKKEIRLLIALLFLILVLPLTILLVKTVQDLRSRARIAEGPATLYLSGPANVQPGETFDVDLYLNPGDPPRQISAFEAYLSYPADKLDIESCEINTASFPIEIKKLCQAGVIDLAAGISLVEPTEIVTPPTTIPTAPPGATNTPTTLLNCGRTCSTDSQCNTSYCHPDLQQCRIRGCPDQTDCKCTCNQVCRNSYECDTGLTCGENGKCTGATCQ